MLLELFELRMDHACEQASRAVEIVLSSSLDSRQCLRFKMLLKYRGQELNTNISFSNFLSVPGTSRQKIPGYPATKLVFLVFEGHTELFGPHPFMWKTPTPLEDIQTQKLWSVLFSLA